MGLEQQDRNFLLRQGLRVRTQLPRNEQGRVKYPRLTLVSESSLPHLLVGYQGMADEHRSVAWEIRMGGTGLEWMLGDTMALLRRWTPCQVHTWWEV